MADQISRFLKLLDQLLPFLETSPAWLRIWVYLLILLNFVTAAGVVVYYLASKQQQVTERSLKYFSIDRPKNDEEIPLGVDHSWMLVGKFPVLAGDQDAPHDLKVEVLRLPDRQSVPQNGTPRISTVRGEWRYESARFAGEGSYEIIATASLGGKSDWRPLTVKCINKAQAYQHSIQSERESRGAPRLRLADPETVSLAHLKEKLHLLDGQFWDRYTDHNDLDGASAVLTKAFDLLDPVLPVFPNDFDIQNFRAYFLKDYAMVMRDRNRPADFEAALDQAAKMFEAIRQQAPSDASAWNGLGSVFLLRGDAKTALQYINRALELQPNYAAALDDRATALDLLKKQEAQSKGRQRSF